MQSVSCITVLENFVGSEIKVEEVDRLSLLSLEQRSELYDVLEQFYDSYELPPKEPNAIRLLLHGTGPGRYAFLFSPWAGDSGNLTGEIQQFTQKVGVFLLYSHTVVIPDPLTRFFTRRAEYRNNLLRSFSDDYGFRKFVTWFAMILSLKELIEAGVVHLFPEALYNEDNFAHSEALSRRDMEDPELMEHARRLMPHDGDASTVRGIPIPILGINNILLQCQSTESSAIAPNGIFYDLLQRKYDILTADLRAAYRIESLNVHSLRNVAVPVFDILNHRDLVELRKNEELFRNWRMDLSALLSALETSPFDEVTNRKEICRKADEMFYPKYHDLNERLASSSLLSSLKSGTAKFGIRTLVTYVLSGSLLVALAAASGAEITNVLYDSLFKGTKKEQRALVKHYAVLFEEAENI
jgi:hypothetical protein